MRAGLEFQQRNRGRQASSALKNTAEDLRHLLGRGYPRERCLTLVGDHHALDATQRHLLLLEVFAPEATAFRRQRVLPLKTIADRPVPLDGHNQLITLETALAGGALLLADDGVVRDIVGRGRGYALGPHTEAATGLLLNALAQVAQMLIYLDAPLSRSSEPAQHLRDMLMQAGLADEAQAVSVPERRLPAHNGLVASSDSALLDAVTQPLDLAGIIISRAALPRALAEVIVKKQAKLASRMAWRA
ncbi:DUF434 domain-containing protein [Desulfarculales bacterium]